MAQREPLTADQRNSFVAAFLGWTMDAFDYFLVVLVYAEIAKDFGVPLTQMAFLTTATLLMRPVGALIFGVWADRVGRRIPLIVDVCFYSLVGFLCAFAPNFTVLLVLRLLYGIGMGGEWGLGAALAMEKIPTRAARLLLRACCRRATRSATCWPRSPSSSCTTWLGLSWRWLFALSIIPALITPAHPHPGEESEVWQDGARRCKSRPARRSATCCSTRRSCAASSTSILLMTAFNWMSHGTQDIYPTFLKDDRRRRRRARDGDRRIVDRDDLQHRRDHRRRWCSARCRSGSAGAA